MKLTKALAIGGASTAGVGATAFGAKELTSRIQEGVRRSNLVHQAEIKSVEIEDYWSGYGLKALRDSSADVEWKVVYWGKIWGDGFYKGYGNYDMNTWEGKFWERINGGILPVTDLTTEEINGIPKSDGWEKYKEMCLAWYAKGKNRVHDPGTGHICLGYEDEDSKKRLEDIKSEHESSKKDPEKIFWNKKLIEKGLTQHIIS